MKNYIIFSFLFGLLAFSACKNDDEDPVVMPDYQITIVSPNTDAKHVGDNIHLHIEFTDKNEGTVHHINVRIYNKADNTKVLFDGPAEAHVHQDKSYTFESDVLLDPAIVEGHTDWILEAKVWGHDEGIAVVTESIEFHVHPM